VDGYGIPPPKIPPRPSAPLYCGYCVAPMEHRMVGVKVCMHYLDISWAKLAGFIGKRVGGIRTISHSLATSPPTDSASSI
jgi:hypothetical protein